MSCDVGCCAVIISVAGGVGGEVAVVVDAFVVCDCCGSYVGGSNDGILLVRILFLATCMPIVSLRFMITLTSLLLWFVMLVLLVVVLVLSMVLYDVWSFCCVVVFGIAVVGIAGVFAIYGSVGVAGCVMVNVVVGYAATCIVDGVGGVPRVGCDHPIAAVVVVVVVVVVVLLLLLLSLFLVLVLLLAVLLWLTMT